MCKGFARRDVQRFSLNLPISPMSPYLSSSSGPQRQKSHPKDLSSIPQVIFITKTFPQEAPPVMPRPGNFERVSSVNVPPIKPRHVLHHQSISEPWELVPPFDSFECVSSTPRIPLRQASVEACDEFSEDDTEDAFIKGPSAHISTKASNVSNSVFEESVEEFPKQVCQQEEQQRPAIIRRKSLPSIKPFQGSQVGGNCPKLPERKRSLTQRR